MTQPHEMKLDLPMKLANGVVSTTTKVWDMLVASKNGNLEKVRHLASDCPELIYAHTIIRRLFILPFVKVILIW